MPKSSKFDAASSSLVKSSLAKRLRDEISSGTLPPGTRIIEGTWGRKLGVAQGSIREAINLLAQEGFVTKVSGRSARVVSLNEQDVLQLYELRGAVEGLAARLAAARHADIAKLQEAVDAMRRASKKNRTADLVDADRSFILSYAGFPEILIWSSMRAAFCGHFSHSPAFASSPANRTPRPGTAIWKRISASQI